MKPEEETQFIERLSKEFILIPKGRFYHCVGGAVALFVVALGINIGSVYTAINSTTAQKATEHIEDLKKKADIYLAELTKTNEYVKINMLDEYVKINMLGEYVKINTDYNIKTTDQKYGLFISSDKPVSNGSNVVVAEGRAWSWQFSPKR